MKILTQILQRAQKSPDVILAVAVAAILGSMIVPLPEWLLDTGIALNLAASMALLVAALYARDALRVSAFPTLLLFTTLFRLALNVSSTRLALAEGHAGEIIQAFGDFVVRGEYMVGAVIFAILTLVQFLVVAKGAERVAEVSARFTLDAMPGKQMAIDADLRAGAINQAQARSRRRELERESQMFGAMDGAMKFVKGDVIAGLIIVVVNLVGGIAIGVLQNGMTVSDAAANYALIAIGDGLVSQLPSLCITIAAGLVVTRVAPGSEEQSLGSEILVQFFGEPRTLFAVAALCFGLGLIPGMPHATFILLSGGLAAAAYWRKKRPAVDAEKPATQTAAPASEAKPSETYGVTPLVLDLSVDMSAVATEEEGALAQRELPAVREALFNELGVRFPGIRVRTQASYLPKGGYRFLVDELPCGQGKLQPDACYAPVNPADLAFLQIQAEPVIDPSSGRTVSKVAAAARQKLMAAQVAFSPARVVLLQHVKSLLRKRAASFLGVQEVQQLVTGFEQQAPALVKEALTKVPLPLLTDVLKRLVQEDVSIRNLRVIFEALVAPSTEGDAAALAERCRSALHRYFSHRFAPSGQLFAYLVDPAIENSLRRHGPGAAGMDPEDVGQILEAARQICAKGNAVVLASPDVRRTLRRLCESVSSEIAVLTYGELDPDLQIRPIGRMAAARLAA